MTKLAGKRTLVVLLALGLLSLALPGAGQARSQTLPVVSISADSLTDWQGKADVRLAVLS